MGAIPCTRVCIGALDPVTPVDAAREVAEALPEGIVTLEVIANSGHFPWKDARDRYWPIVTDFVAAAGGVAPVRTERRSGRSFGSSGQ